MSKKKNYLIGGVIAVAVVAIGMTAGSFLRKDREASGEPAAKAAPVENGVVTYNGEKYRYNSSIKTYLYMGVDKDGPVAEAEDGISGGQSDAMFLLVNDPKHEKNSIIAINRHTMCAVDVYDRDGNFEDTNTLQICLQHGYGNGLRESCIRAEKAVSRLFYNLPIDGFLSMRLDGIPKLNDAVGGVEVEIMDDINYGDISLTKGEVRTLTGNEAYAYLRKRDMEEFASSDRRQERHIQYMLSFFEKAGAQIGTSVSKALNLYDSIKDYTVTDIDFANESEDVLKYGFDQSNMYSVPGETKMGEKFEEFYVDDDAFYELILAVFYEKE